MSQPIRAVICDFGGVLTTPLLGAFTAFQDSSGVTLEALGSAMARITEEDGAHPLFALETGEMSEADFVARLERALSEDLGRTIELREFGETYFQALHPNEPMIELMRSLKGRGNRMAILTNNVREWEGLWRSMLPVDEIFELVVDSAFVGVRKPDPRIYRLTLERLDLPAEECLFIDDTEVNCDAARAEGMAAVWFRSNAQAIAEIERALGDAQLSEPSRSQQ